MELKSESAQEQSTAFVNWHSERSQDEREKRKTHKNLLGVQGVEMAEQCVSIFRTQRAISLLSCLFYSKCHSVSESAFRALRQRCRCTGMKYLQPRPNGVGFTRASGLSKISRRPSAKKSKLLKTILTHRAAEGHCQISFSILPTIWMLLLKKALQ